MERAVSLADVGPESVNETTSSARTADRATTAVLFSTDRGFLIPAVTAALQVSERSTHLPVDILILVHTVPDDDIDALNDAFSVQRIRFMSGSPDSYLLDEGNTFFQSHVPPVAIARLSAAAAIPDHYEDLVYMDCDVQIVDEIDRLLAYKVPFGRIMASLDEGLLALGEPASHVSRFYRDYTRALGLSDPMSYFNSGVFALKRSTLLDKGPMALEYFRKNSAKCIQHDQSALNAVFHGRRDALSPRYNFMPQFREFGGLSSIDPAIIHFSARVKPWHEDAPPWMRPYAAAYDDALREHPVLLPFRADLRRRPKHSLYHPGRLKSVAVSAIKPLRVWRRRRAFRRYLSHTAFAVG